MVEPFSNRLICQCYNRPVVQQDHQQVQVTSMQQTSDLKVEPALYNSAYLRVNSPERKGVRAPQVSLFTGKFLFASFKFNLILNTNKLTVLNLFYQNDLFIWSIMCVVYQQISIFKFVSEI